MVCVTVGSHMCTKGFLNYLSVIVVCLKAVIKDEIVKFSKNCGTCAIKESGGVKVEIMEFQKIIIIINCHNGSRKPRKFSRSQMTKRTALLNSSG